MSCPVDKTKETCPREGSTKSTENISTDKDSPRSLERDQSSILKPDGSLWLYPSEEQFYQAIKRKGKSGGEQVSSIVKIHNTVNEKVWKEILKW